MNAQFSRAGVRPMASYADLQAALARYAGAEERYWLALEDNAKAIQKGLTDYLEKAGQTTEFNGANTPYVCLGDLEDGEFCQKSVSKLPACDGGLDFMVRIIIESDVNPRYKAAHLINLEMRIEGETLEVLICEDHQKHAYTFPDVFNERHQTQLFDAITNTIIKRLDTSHFS